MRAGKCAIMVASALLLLLFAISTIIVGMLATLPGHLDEFLLTNDEYCYPSTEHGDGDHIIDVSSKRKRRPSVQVDYGDYESRMVLNGQQLFEQQQKQQPQQQQQQHHQQMPKKTKTLYQLLQHTENSILRRISLHLWEESTKDDNPIEIRACPIHPDDNQQPSIQNIGEYERHEEEAQVRKLHPMCEGHRKLRSRLRFQQLLLPWNWYFRNQFRIRGLSVQSLAMDVAFESKKDDLQSPWWKIGWDIVSGKDVNAARVNVVPRRRQSPQICSYLTILFLASTKYSTKCN